jgi:hypothetical protein
MNARVTIREDWSGVDTLGAAPPMNGAVVGVVRCHACAKAMEITGAALTFGSVLTIKARCLSCAPLNDGEVLTRPKRKYKEDAY